MSVKPHSRLVEWGYDHETVCHAAGEYARDDDGDEFCEVHVNTLEGFWSLLQHWDSSDTEVLMAPRAGRLRRRRPCR